jgi:hypothetical protein
VYYPTSHERRVVEQGEVVDGSERTSPPSKAKREPS